MKKKIKRILAIGLVGGILLGLLVVLILRVNINDIMTNLAYEYYELFGEWGVYLAIFIISIIGNASIVMPVPYLLALMTLIIVLPINPLIAGLFAGGGAALGESTAWLLGRGAGEAINLKKSTINKKIEGLHDLIQKGYGFPALILFNATPLPGDLLLMALGMAKYSLKKALLAVFIGKVIMTLCLGLFAFISTIFPPGQFILGLYGIEIAGSEVKSVQSPVVSNIITVATIAVLIIILTVDWDELFKKLKKKP